MKGVENKHNTMQEMIRWLKKMSKRIQKRELVVQNLGQQWDTYTYNC